MIKLAARTFDIYDDLPDLKYARAVATKCASVQVASPEEVEALPDREFALVLKTASGAVLRRYPIHTADAVKLSRAYFNVCGAGLPEEIEAAISIKLAAADQHFGVADHALPAETVAGIQESVAYLDAEKLAAPKLPAWTSESWGLTLGDRNYFPLHTAELTKTALSRFGSTADGLTPHERFAYARNLYKQASVLGVEVPANHSVNNYTNDEVNVDSLKLAIADRKRAMKAAGLATTILDQLSEAAGCALDRGDIEDDDVWQYRESKHAALERLPAEKIIQVLQGVDKVAGFGHTDYMRGLLDPFAAVFKRAAAMPATIVDGVDLATVPEARLSEMFGPEFVTEFLSNPVQVYQSLPDPMKAMIRDAAVVPDTAPSSVGSPQSPLAPQYSNAGSGSVF